MLVKDAARKAAKTVLETRWHIGPLLPVFPDEIAKSYGIEVRFVAEEGSTGTIHADPRDIYERQTFAIARELGRYIERMEYGDTQHEDFANEFALNLLMPEDEFAYYWDLSQSVSDLADVFGVSVDAVEERLDQLCEEGLVPGML